MKHASIFIFAAALTLFSCAKEGWEETKTTGEAIKFTSYRQQVYTRADIDEFNFDEGTKYTLVAVQSAATEAAYQWVSKKGFVNQPQVGTESADHDISYTPIALFSRNEQLDFFGLVYGDAARTTAPALSTPSDNATPTAPLEEYAVDATKNRLHDLMLCNDKTVRNRTSSSGTITLPFKHALAALNFVVAKQDESGDMPEERQLEQVKVTEVRLDNVAKKADMNLYTGNWTWTAANVGSRVVYTGAAIPITPTPESIGDADILVFPNDDGVDNNAYVAANPYKYYTAAGDESANKGEQVIVTVKLEGLQEYDPNTGYKWMNKDLDSGVSVVDGACEISLPIRVYEDSQGNDDGPLHFLSNHKYTLSIFIMRNNVRIVAVSPQVYEWVDVALDPVTDPTHVATLGQPITFGTTVWMDRNLGATSADCETDWLHTLGYYWEHGRNIPFILDVEQFKQRGYVIESGIPRKTPGGAQVFGNENKMIYTWDKNGNKHSQGSDRTLVELKGNHTDYDGNYVAINPGDEGIYDFVFKVEGSVSYWYQTHAHQQDETDRQTSHYWLDVNNQPVPKGWRLPTIADCYSVLPEESWIWSNTTWTAIGVDDYPKYVDNDDAPIARRYLENYIYQFFRGSYKVDPNASASADYSNAVQTTERRVYGIKWQGTDKAYRYMIEEHIIPTKVNGYTPANAGFIRFSAFPASKTDKFMSNGDKKWNLQKFDWDHPSAYMDFPLQGQLYGTDLRFTLFGTDLKLAIMECKKRSDVSSWQPGDPDYYVSDAYTFKISNDGSGLYGRYPCTSSPTRLVRDI